MKNLPFALLLLLVLPHTIVPRDAHPALVLSTLEELRQEFLTVPCRNEERLPAVKNLFLKMGAPEADISIEKIKDVENIIIRKQGDTDEKIVIGAHYDLAGDGSCGATDNWTGIVAIAHIYKSLKDVKLRKTLIFAGFGREEEGLVGSKAMAKQIKKETVPSYCAMVNVDGISLTTPQSLTNVSTKKLTELSKELAKKINVPFEPIFIGNASSDSVSFKDKKIPAISIVGMSQDWPKIYHSKNDQAARVNPNNVYLSYRLALELVTTINDNECGAYRK
ncbi:MAG TPA: M20/M25/M40 family metallo-hydrolase [Blastocatellia bacterium]|nr:M20/M25/M40 family metallo-hydrolase [Blastocatellia bacterium]